MEYILPYLTFNMWEIIGLAFFFILLVIQMRYYIVYYRKPYNYILHAGDKEIACSNEITKVSVVIEAENESVRLAENLPNILAQDYPDFEVVVVNKGSTDETYELLQSLKLNHPNLYHTYIPNSYDKKLSSRKLALTVGLKAANGDVVVFLESYSRPISKNWLRLMVEQLHDEKEVALGYSYFHENKNKLNRLARFDNLIMSLQYLSVALKREPYCGTYRNIAFKKELFFKKKGFASVLGVDGGEELFIHEMMNSSNTVVVIDQDAFVESDLDSNSLWNQIRKTYSAVKSRLGKYATRVFPFDVVSRYLFHSLFVTLMVLAIVNSNWALLIISTLLWLIRQIHQYIVINKATKYFKAGKFRFSLLWLELILPIYKLRFKRYTKKRF